MGKPLGVNHATQLRTPSRLHTLKIASCRPDAWLPFRDLAARQLAYRVTKTTSFEEYLRPVAASVPPALISPSAFSDINSVARVLPATLAYNMFVFECHLGEKAPRADFSVLAKASYGRGSLAGLHPTSTLPARLMTEPIWRRVVDFAVRWADPSSPLYRTVNNAWLEFDVDGVAPAIPIPSVFIGLRPSCQAGARGVAYEPNLDGYIATIETVIQLLSGNELAPRKREMLSDCFRALRSSEHVFQVGLMLSRGTEAIRLCIKLRTVGRTVEYLAGVGWPCSEADVLSVLEPIARLVDRVYLDIDVGETVHRKIGFECYFDGNKQPKAEPRWGVFLDSLVRDGLCTTDKRNALLVYPGYVNENTEGIPWPRALRRASQMRGGRSLSTFIRSLNWVKIVYQPGDGLEAKAYLTVNHHWHTPALWG